MSVTRRTKSPDALHTEPVMILLSSLERKIDGVSSDVKSIQANVADGFRDMGERLTRVETQQSSHQTGIAKLETADANFDARLKIAEAAEVKHAEEYRKLKEQFDRRDDELKPVFVFVERARFLIWIMFGGGSILGSIIAAIIIYVLTHR